MNRSLGFSENLNLIFSLFYSFRLNIRWYCCYNEKILLLFIFFYYLEEFFFKIFIKDFIMDYFYFFSVIKIYL